MRPTLILFLIGLVGIALFCIFHFRSTDPNPASGVVVVQGALRDDKDSTVSIPITPIPKTASETIEGLALVARSEQRSAIWADRSEAAVLKGLSSVPFLGVGAPFAVRCATTICEVKGEAPAALSDQDLDQYWQLIRNATNDTSLVDEGLQIRGADFGQSADPRSFVLYYRAT